MHERTALKTILVLSVLGVAFSGTLSYLELFGASAASCPTVGAPGTLFGYPACVYGFGMFVILTAIAAVGVGSRGKGQ